MVTIQIRGREGLTAKIRIRRQPGSMSIEKRNEGNTEDRLAEKNP